MVEPTRPETQLGLATLKGRFQSVGIQILEQRRDFSRQATYFVIGTVIGIVRHSTSLLIPDSFLNDLPNSKEYQEAAYSFAYAVAKRCKNCRPDVFFCLSGLAVEIAIVWPFEPHGLKLGYAWIPIDVTDALTGKIAKCQITVPNSFLANVFEFVKIAVNNVRLAIDEGLVSFYDLQLQQASYQPIAFRPEQIKSRSQSEIRKFLTDKVTVLGYRLPDNITEVWTADPWDAEYLGTSLKQLDLATRLLESQDLLDTPYPPYATPSDDLLAKLAESEEESETFHLQRNITRDGLPKKEQLLKDIQSLREQNSLLAILVIDLDHFKSVNDTRGHSEGDKCLDRVIATLATVTARKGKIYRWGGGDEFAVCLRDFSTEEAQATAERIRIAVEKSRPAGGEIAVTASIGVCATDQIASETAEQILDFADHAMYESKDGGRNRVSAYRVPQNVENTPLLPESPKTAENL